MTAWRDAPLVDEAVAADLARDLDPEDLSQILDAFVVDIGSRAGELAMALKGGHVERAQRAVHSLKGAALNLGFFRLGQMCAHLQQLAQAGDLAAIVGLWPTFAATCNDSLGRLGHSGLAFEIDSSIVRP